MSRNDPSARKGNPSLKAQQARIVALATIVQGMSDDIKSLDDVRRYVDQLEKLGVHDLAKQTKQIIAAFGNSPQLIKLIKEQTKPFIETLEDRAGKIEKLLAKQQGEIAGVKTRLTALEDQVDATGRRTEEAHSRLDRLKEADWSSFMVTLVVTGVMFVLFLGFWHNARVIWPMKLGVSLAIGWACGMLFSYLGGDAKAEKPATSSTLTRAEDPAPEQTKANAKV